MPLIGISRGKKFHKLLAGVLLGTASNVSAVTVALDAPGTLADALTGINADTKELTITGKVYASELSLLRDSLPNLTRLDIHALDISPASISPYAFTAMSLTDVKLPDNVTVIGEGAFAAVPLTTLALPVQLDSIAPYAFAYSGLTSLTLPAKLSYVGKNAFGNCTSLVSVDGGRGLVTLGDNAFQGTALTGIDLSGSSSLRYVGGSAFEGCSDLTSVILPESGSYTVGSGAFMGCEQLSLLSLAPQSELPKLMLADSPGVDLSGVLTDGVHTIGAYALSGNGSDFVTLPASLDSIATHGMERMTGIDTIDVVALNSVPALGEDVWAGVDQSEVVLETSNDMSDRFKAADQWREFRISQPTGIEGVESDLADVKLYFENKTLIVKSSIAIAGIDAVSLGGIVLAHIAPNAVEASVDASHWPGKVCIVVLTLANGTKATYTLSR
jgi:hypothetical protein